MAAINTIIPATTKARISDARLGAAWNNRAQTYIAGTRIAHRRLSTPTGI
jgi:hypothetical protein